MTLEHLLMPMYYYGYVIVASWLILMAVWVVGNFTAKPDVSSRPRIVRWLWQLPLLGLLMYVLRNPYDDVTVLERAFFHFGPAVDWVGAFVTVVGVVFAIWARYRLGRNWGSDTKEDPVLVTSGPYAYVRHPIYAGYLLSHAAFACAYPTVWNISVIILCDTALVVRAFYEEKLLKADGAYQSYCQRVGWHIVPGVF